MSSAQLRAAWRQHWRQSAPDVGPDLLRRGIAWKLQARVHGELTTDAKRALRQATEALRKGEVVSSSTVQLKAGTRLVREWRGKTYHVIVLEDGYELDGRRYTSLTQIACAIAGVRWSGPVFFGIKKRTSVRRKAAT
jgi:hypothetical protein